MGLAGLNSAGQQQAGWTQVRVDVVLLGLKAGHSGRASLLHFGGRILSSSGNLGLCSEGLQLIGRGLPTSGRIIYFA